MPALRTIALLVMAACGTAGHAAGLGPIRLQSSLGQPLRVSVPLPDVNMPELPPSCIKIRLDQPDGTPMMAVRAAVASSGETETASILLSTRQPVHEPAVTLSLQVMCDNSMQRSYQLLLDPVLMLPQLPQPVQPAQQELQARTGSEADKNRLREQAMIAPVEDAGAPATARRAIARKARNNPSAPVAAQGAFPDATRKPVAAQQKPHKVTRSVLKLSGDDIAIAGSATFSPGLKLSDTLSESRDTGDAQGAAELKKAYDRFAAVLRDEDPLQNGERQLSAMQARVQELQSQTDRLREQGERQRQADREALARMRRETVSSRWVVALGGLLLAALGAIAWLHRRIREIGRKQPTGLWARTSLSHPTEPGNWESTPGTDRTLVVAEAMSNPRKGEKSSESSFSDWERGVPLDCTLAVDWASRQATLQEPALPTPAARAADQRHGRHEVAAEEVTADDGVQGDAEPAAWQAEQASSPVKRESLETLQGAHAAGKTAAAAAPRADAEQAAAGKCNGGVQPLMKIGEISALMQEAEFWMLLNDPERAIEILEPSLHAGHLISPVPWIYLLHLYRVTGRQENYRALVTRLKQVFNASAPAWAEPDAEAPPRSLRDYPHVVKAIEDLWEGEEIVPYLESLLLDERQGGRAGFDLAVYREIIHLIGVAGDPETPRRRQQLSFDDPQPRLISQKARMPSASPARGAPLISEDAAEVFGRATSWQATGRQVASNTAAPKAVESKAVEPKAAEPRIMSPQMPALNPLAAAAQAPASARAISDVEMALPVLDVAPAPVPAPAPAPAAAAVAPAVLAPPAASAEDAERLADMARKLDLVLAYQEIGENAGARVLLEEVIQGGSPLQVQKAKAMLKKLLKEINWQ